MPGTAVGQAAAPPWRNWSGHLKANPASRLVPSTEDELVSMLQSTRGAIRPVGAGHSFSPLVPTDGHLLVLDNLNGLVSHDRQAMTAELMAGTRLSDAGALLDDIGQAMYNLPDIDRQTLAGAIATATHGTGKHLKSLSGYVNNMRLVTPFGDVVDLDAHNNADVFHAARVSLGALGIVTRIGFKNRAPFNLLGRTWMEKTKTVIDQFEALSSEWQHFEMMPLLHSDYALVIAHKETSDAISPMVEEEDDGAFLKLVNATPVALRGTLINTLASDIEPAEGIDVSYKSLTNLRFDRFNEMEYSVPAASGPECLEEILDTVKREATDVTIPLEYRIVDADDAWISMFNGGRRVSISVHRLARYDYQPLFGLVEPIFWKYGGRPHWGKVHTLGRQQLQELYPRFEDFVFIQQSLDPEGRMLNRHLAYVLGR
ncbi:MAG: D-arabinono-1,4-lactone oxidase [Pseudomonadales bacterium]